MIIPIYKIYCVRCGKTCFSHVNSWWCDECREKQFAKQDEQTKKDGKQE